MRILKNIEDKNQEQLKEIKNERNIQSDSKDSKATGSKSFLTCDSRNGFYIYRLSEFVKISSIESKYDALEMFYQDFIDLKNVDTKPENINHRFTVLNNASKLYDNLTKE